MKVYTLAGTELNLKEPPLSSGGEGAVYEISGYFNKVAKIYHSSGDASKREDKIRAMVNFSQTQRFASANICGHIAWPLSPLFDSRKKFIGFGMNRINSSAELDMLYCYPPKKGYEVDIKHKIGSLISLCEITQALHSTGQVFGDFNPNNIKVNSDGTVTFLDADSYHFTDKGKSYKCTVCASGYAAPEVIRNVAGTTYEKCTKPTFTKESDLFALAVHIFRMLMNGVHPFTGKKKTSRKGSPTHTLRQDKMVELCITPFFNKNCSREPPVNAPEVSSLPDYIYRLFERAFIDGDRDPKARPAAGEWKAALERFRGSLTRCRRNRLHYYWDRLGECPYCKVEVKRLGRVQMRQPSGGQVGIPAGSAVRTSAAPLPAPVFQSAAPAVQKKVSVKFMLAVLILALTAAAISFKTFLPALFGHFVKSQDVRTVCSVISALAGFSGTVLSAAKLAPGSKRGYYSWWEYAVIPIAAALFCLLGAAAIGIIVGVCYLLFYAVMILAVIALIAGIACG